MSVPIPNLVPACGEYLYSKLFRDSKFRILDSVTLAAVAMQLEPTSAHE
jgi:hypothetical protein